MIHVIIGPPCGGKSSYIREHAHPGDLIIDYDVIAQALGATETHHAEGLIRKAAFAAREAAISVALGESWAETWLIHSIPSDAQLTRYRSVGAQILVRDPGRSTVEAWAHLDGRQPNTFEGIEKWYARKTHILSVAAGTGATDSETALARKIVSRQSERLQKLAKTGEIGANSRRW